MTLASRCMLTIVVLAACKGDGGGGLGFDDFGGSGIDPDTGVAAEGVGTESGDSTGAPDGDDEDGDATGSSGGDGSGSDGATETGALPTEPCTAIDVVFVIDNTDTMADEQLRLQSTAAAWIDQINAQTPTVVDDIRVGVITTDSSTFVQTDGTGVACGPYASGQPWMTIGETLATELSCAVVQGTTGDPDERPMDMIRDALSDEALAPGGVHDGFLRDDALLVVVLLTDEEDDLERPTLWGSQGDPPDWIDALAGLKESHVGNVVVVSLVGHEKPNACPPFQWDGMEGAEIAERLIELTEAFPQGAVGDICAAEYSTFLFSIVPGIAAACDGFTP